jgi:hypothetical protein
LNGEKPQKAWNYEQPAANFNLAWKSLTSARDTSGSGHDVIPLQFQIKLHSFPFSDFQQDFHLE